MKNGSNYVLLPFFTFSSGGYFTIMRPVATLFPLLISR